MELAPDSTQEDPKVEAASSCDDDEDVRLSALEECAEVSRRIGDHCVPHAISVARMPAHAVANPERDGGLYPYQSQIRELLLGDRPVNLLVASPTGSGKSFAIYEAAYRATRLNGRLYVGEPLIALVEQVHNALSKRGVKAAMRTGPSSKGDGGDAVAVVATYEVLARIGQDSGFADATAVVLDEAHFIGTDRGPVLQEIFHACREGGVPIIALSGTLPNAEDVARFMSLSNGLPTKILGATRRPIELTHYYYDAAAPTGSRFSALKRGEEARRNVKFDEKQMGGIHDKQGMLQFARELSAWDCYPALVVAFSCRTLDAFARDCSCLDLLDRGQKSRVARGFDEMLRSIPQEDKCLFDWLRPLLVRGVALHHGHLPVQYLELVCALAAQRCVKLVFSSSTLSAGIDLPVRTVCLLNTRIPRKEDGQVVFDTIDPLLTQQLCGRAGRPGLEQVGNVVVVGRGWGGYYSALALLERPLPPIVPRSEFTDGDVLRARRQNRSLVLDRLIFEDPSVRQLALVAEKSAALVERAVALADSATTVSACSHLAAQIAKIRRGTKAIFPFCVVDARNGAHVYLVDRGREGVYLVDEYEEGSLLIATKDKRRPYTVPFEFLAEVLEMKKTFAEIAACSSLYRLERGKNAPRPSVADVLLVLFLNRAVDERCLQEAPCSFDFNVIKARLCKDGFLSSEGCLTLVGRAACEIRTCSSPQLVVRAITRYSFMPAAYVSFASLILGSGVEDGTRTGVLDAAFEESLRGDLRVSSSTFNVAAMKWFEGATLAEIGAECDISVGEFCRHVVRVHDVLTEIGDAYGVLGISKPESLDRARVGVNRGLPFVRRGAGRLDDVVDDLGGR